LLLSGAVAVVCVFVFVVDDDELLEFDECCEIEACAVIH
jgi:hypothetical protein